MLYVNYNVVWTCRYLSTTTNKQRLLFHVLFNFLQLPGLSFRVDHLPMSETVMGIWSSLVRLASTAAGSSSAALPGGLFQPPSLTKKPAKSIASKPEAERKHTCT